VIDWGSIVLRNQENQGSNAALSAETRVLTHGLAIPFAVTTQGELVTCKLRPAGICAGGGRNGRPRTAIINTARQLHRTCLQRGDGGNATASNQDFGPLAQRIAPDDAETAKARNTGTVSTLEYSDGERMGAHSATELSMLQ